MQVELSLIKDSNKPIRHAPHNGMQVA